MPRPSAEGVPTVWAVVPVKPLTEAKSRLAPVLSPEERRALVLQLLRHTLRVLNTVEGVAQVLVISADEQVAGVTREEGGLLLREESAPGLNASLRRALSDVEKEGADAALILPGDLPHLTAATVQELLKQAPPPPAVVIAPDRRNEGTNALLLAPPQIIAPRFGGGSFRRHCRAAEAAGLASLVYRSPALALDVDLPEDLTALRAATKR